MVAGGISGQWLYCTDADASVPQDYFKQLDSAASDAVAAIFRFQHMPAGEQDCDSATALYELRLHHYVLGLEYAGSPYAHPFAGKLHSHPGQRLCASARLSKTRWCRGFLYPQQTGKNRTHSAICQGQCIQLLHRDTHRGFLLEQGQPWRLLLRPGGQRMSEFLNTPAVLRRLKRCSQACLN